MRARDPGARRCDPRARVPGAVLAFRESQPAGCGHRGYFFAEPADDPLCADSPKSRDVSYSVYSDRDFTFGDYVAYEKARP